MRRPPAARIACAPPLAAPHLCVVRVVEVLVVEELGGHHHRGDDDAVHVERREGEAGPLDEAVDVHEGQDEALGAARSVLVDAARERGGGEEQERVAEPGGEGRADAQARWRTRESPRRILDVRSFRGGARVAGRVRHGRIASVRPTGAAAGFDSPLQVVPNANAGRPQGVKLGHYSTARVRALQTGKGESKEGAGGGPTMD
jgi:hypothetical protein